MPVILGFEDWPKWLGEEPANNNELKAMLKPFPSERLSMWPVDPQGRQCEEMKALLSAALAMVRERQHGCMAKP